MNSTTHVTREQFEYSIVKTFADYSNDVVNKLFLTETSEQENRKYKLANICQKAIRDYFSVYDGETQPIDDANGLTKVEIEAMVRLFNAICDSNFWYEFPDDV